MEKSKSQDGGHFQDGVHFPLLSNIKIAGDFL